jgi:hypothetical protein
MWIEFGGTGWYWLGSQKEMGKGVRAQSCIFLTCSLGETDSAEDIGDRGRENSNRRGNHHGFDQRADHFAHLRVHCKMKKKAVSAIATVVNFGTLRSTSFSFNIF